MYYRCIFPVQETILLIYLCHLHPGGAGHTVHNVLNQVQDGAVCDATKMIAAHQSGPKYQTLSPPVLSLDMLIHWLEYATDIHKQGHLIER